MKRSLTVGAAALSLLALVSTTAQAELAANAGAQAASSYAGAAFGSPIAFGADWGSAGIGVFGQTQNNNITGRRADGSVGAAFGIGDADRYVGLETQVSVANLVTHNGDRFGDGGAMGFKLHTNLGSGAAFAVGAIGTARWGTAKNTTRTSVYAVATKAFKIGGVKPHALVLNIGIGDQVFRALDTSTGFGKSGAGVFGSMAYYITPQISVIADYTGRLLNAGLSAAPFKKVPLTVTLGGVNLTDRYDTKPQVAMTVGYGVHF